MKTICLIAALLLLVGGSTAQAQTEDTRSLAIERLSCLKREASLPKIRPEHEYDRRSGSMRVKLRFTKPDAPPQVELLRAVADEAMQAKVQTFLRGYRLPCLQANDPPIEAMQEFDLATQRPEGNALIPLKIQEEREQCVVLPKRDLQVDFVNPKGELDVVVVKGEFDGPGGTPPKVTIAFSNAAKRFEAAVQEHVASYRMPCRKAGERPYVFEQTFTYALAGTGRGHVLKKTDFSLVDLLKMVEKSKQLERRFELNSMSCPFKVRYGLRQPHFAINEVDELDAPNANRAEFLQWLASLRIGFTSREQAEDLFGTQLTVSVPCGTLDLTPPQTQPGASS